MVARHALALTILAGSIDLIELHGMDGQSAWVNTREISELRAPAGGDLARHFTPGTRCVVVMGNAKFLATRESCAEIKAKITAGGVAKMS